MNQRDEHTECCFDTYCKRLLKYEVIDAIREYERLGQREVTFSELTRAEERQLQYIDAYFPARRVFSVRGADVEIADESLVRALALLSADRRDIVLLAYLFDMTDVEIAKQLGVNRSTVQYRRTSSLEQLRKLITEED